MVEINAADFETLQDAIDALPPEGGKILIPAGVSVITQKAEDENTTNLEEVTDG